MKFINGETPEYSISLNCIVVKKCNTLFISKKKKAGKITGLAFKNVSDDAWLSECNV